MDLVFVSPADFRRTALAAIAVIVLGIVVGLSGVKMEVLSAATAPPPAPTVAQPIASAARSEPASDDTISRSIAGYTVTIDGIDRSATETTVRYDIASKNEKFDLILGARAMNTDGTVVFPIRSAGPDRQIVHADGTTELLGPTPSITFDNRELRPGAILKFGPFLGADAVPVAFSATGADLRGGIAVTLAGEEFEATMEPGTPGEGVGDTTLVKLTNVSTNVSVQLDWPSVSELTWAVNGQPVEVFHGGGGFNKKAGYEISGTRVEALLPLVIGDGDVVEVHSATVGRLTQGDWSFPLD